VETWSTVMTRVLVPLASDASSSMPPLGVTTAHTLVCLPMLRLVRDEVALILVYFAEDGAPRLRRGARERGARGLGQVVRYHQAALGSPGSGCLGDPGAYVRPQRL
jgi:hypothetical protein